MKIMDIKFQFLEKWLELSGKSKDDITVKIKDNCDILKVLEEMEICLACDDYYDNIVFQIDDRFFDILYKEYKSIYDDFKYRGIHVEFHFPKKEDVYLIHVFQNKNAYFIQSDGFKKVFDFGIIDHKKSQWRIIKKI
jgi:hypothetical protein